MSLKKPLSCYMRALHRDIGFFVIGLTIVFCISGVLLIYRYTGLLKEEKTIERRLAPGMQEHELRRALHLRHFRVSGTDGDIVRFNTGTYNRTTGIAVYKKKALPSILNKFNRLHMASTKSVLHWFSLIYAVLLLFLAVSSFWMYRPGTTLFRRGICIAGAGIAAAVIILLL